jgi:predicted MPP superfamily phosphohydrolase
MGNLPLTTRTKAKKRKKRYISVFLGLMFLGLVSCTTIHTETYTLETASLVAGSSIRIVLISDLHNTIHGENQTTLIQKIKEQDPDLILLSGDIFDDIVPIFGTELLLAGIAGVAPMYYVTGNHEYLSRNMSTIRLTLTSYGVSILSDSYVRLEVNGNEIIIAGVEDPDKKLFGSPEYDQISSMRKAFTELNEASSFKILIAHRPENIKHYREYSFDLVVSGHAHGGQVRIPYLINGLYAPNQGIFPKYAGGLYKHGSLTHIVSRGLSIDPMLPRICNPPELVIIDVKSRVQKFGQAVLE